MRVAPKIVLSSDEIQRLEKLARGRRTPVRLAQRSTIVLSAAEGNENKEIASQLGISRETVGRWRRRYAESGMAGIEKDAPRPGRTPSISAAKVREIVRKTTRSKPKAGTHWSSRTMAAEAGVSASSIRRVLHNRQLCFIAQNGIKNIGRIACRDDHRLGAVLRKLV